jgi:uncharacterized protein YgiM (DUF1202 family)
MLRKLILITAILALHTVTLFPQDLIEGEPVLTIVDTHYLKVRSEPLISPGNLIGKVPGGIQLRKLDEQEGWYQVALPDGTTGWINGTYAVEERARTQLEVTASVARLRRSNSMSSEALGNTIQGVRLEILDQAGDWYRVRLPHGEEGWVSAEVVALREVSPATAAVVAEFPMAATQVAEVPSPRQAPMPMSALPETRNAPSPETAKSEISWVPDETFIFLLSTMVGLLIFILLSSQGMFYLMNRDLKSFRRELLESMEATGEEDQGVSEEEAAKLDEMIAGSLESLTDSLSREVEANTGSQENGSEKPVDLEQTVKEQKNQITHLLKLIELQNKKLCRQFPKSKKSGRRPAAKIPEGSALHFDRRKEKRTIITEIWDEEASDGKPKLVS